MIWQLDREGKVAQRFESAQWASFLSQILATQVLAAFIDIWTFCYLHFIRIFGIFLFSSWWFVWYWLDQHKALCGYFFIFKASYKVNKKQSHPAKVLLLVMDGKWNLIYMFLLSQKLMPVLNFSVYLQLENYANIYYRKFCFLAISQNKIKTNILTKVMATYRVTPLANH